MIDVAVIMGLNELGPVRRWVAGRRDGRRLERFTEVCLDLPGKSAAGPIFGTSLPSPIPRGGDGVGAVFCGLPPIVRHGHRHRLETCATGRRGPADVFPKTTECRVQPQPHVPPPHAAARAASRRSMASDVGVIESPPSAVQRSSRGICSATRLAVATTSSNGIT